MAAIIPYLFDSVYRSTLCPSCILPNACFCSFDFASAFGYGSIVTAPRKNSAATIAGIVRLRFAIIVSSDLFVRTTLAPIGRKEIAECAVCDPNITVRLQALFVAGGVSLVRCLGLRRTVPQNPPLKHPKKWNFAALERECSSGSTMGRSAPAG